MFRIIYHHDQYGPTVDVEDPKIEAYKQMWYIQNVLFRCTQLEINPDSTAYTVQGDGLESITFLKERGDHESMD